MTINNIPDNVLSLVDRLENGGYETYVVGGAVRDFIRNEPCHDYDIATSAKPSDCLALFSDMRIIETGIKHGTVTVVSGNINVEITTFRKDGEYDDARHPKNVEFTSSVEIDLSRRDFTINAMAYNPKRGLVDLFGGKQDIKNRIIRTVGDEKKRFSEDALRILRAMRFSSVLCYEIESKTRNAMFEFAHLLKKISPERIREEFTKLILGYNAVKVICEYIDIIGVFIPELLPTVGFSQYNPHHKYDVFTHTANALLYTDPDICERYAVLFHDIGKPACFSRDNNGTGHFYSHEKIGAKMVDDICRRLKFDNKTREEIIFLVSHHGLIIEPDKKYVKRAVAKHGADKIRKLFRVKRADCCGQGVDNKERLSYLHTIENILSEIEKDDACISLSSLAVDGHDIMFLGFSGKEIGAALQLALFAVIDGIVKNDKSDIMNYLAGMKNKII